jgi:two-component system response regulator YcbB
VLPFRILIIDDDPAVVRMLQRIIEERALGAVAGREADGPGGEQAALALRPDIVLIDLLMPGQDGLETIRHLKERGFEGVFIMLSQVADKELVARAYKAGVEFYIYKPLNLTEVVSVLRRVTESLQMKQTLQHIRASLGPLTGAAAPPPAPHRAEPDEPDIRRAARQVLADLGILGEAGAADLTAVALLPRFRSETGRSDFELGAVYTELSDHYLESAAESKAPGAKAIEQRLRRAASAALSRLAALGLEDFADPRFERLAHPFFDFTEVRTEMNRLRTGKGLPGRINLKRFLAAYLHEVESALQAEA